MNNDLRQRLEISATRLDEINALLTNPDTRVVNDILVVVDKYGTPEEINRKAAEAGRLPVLLEHVAASNPEYLQDLEWLQAQRDTGAFVSIADYRRDVLGERAETTPFNDELAVTLEISACQYFPWLIAIAGRALEQADLMPGRFIKVRKMKEQEADGDLAAFAAAMQIIGASYVETLDTKGTDGANVHLDGPATLAGYLGGVGQPNDYVTKWVDEYLYYNTTYGLRQVLNVNAGTVMAACLLHRLGVDIEFKISVLMGTDNPYSLLWVLLAAKLFSRDDGSTPLIGLNWSNSVNNETIAIAAEIRRDLGFEDVVRFEHHITETFRNIVRQPYNRRHELPELAAKIANISAKHEGSDPEIEATREHPSDIFDYFRDKAEIIASGDWEKLAENFMDKFESVSRTARTLTEHGLAVIAARNLHEN